MHASIAVRTPAPYQGGKRNLSKRLCALIDATPHRTYVEPFVGMGGIFFKRSRAARAEVINDISGDVATLFRILREHNGYFLEQMRFLLTSRHEFDRLKAIAPEHLTDLQRAVRFLYLQRLAFGGKVVGRHFGVDRRTPGRFNVTELGPMLTDIGDRLAAVTIEQLPYANLIERYDSAETLFYLDPPYWGGEGDYGAGVFERADFELIARQLAAIAGKFILSINDTEGAREVFGRFRVDEVPTTWSLSTASAGGAKKVVELVVRNFG